MNPSEKTRAVCDIVLCLPAQCVVSLSLLICFRPLCPLLCLIRAPLVLQPICILAPCPCWPPQHSNIQQKSLSFQLNPSEVCVLVGLCMIEVYGSFYLRELLKLVWQERLCYADHPVSLISHLRNSAEWTDSRLWFLSPLLYLIYKWKHLIFMSAPVKGGWWVER